MKRLMRFFKDEEGVTAIEYGLIAALIALVIIIAVALVGTSVSTTFSNVATHVSSSAKCSSDDLFERGLTRDISHHRLGNIPRPPTTRQHKDVSDRK